MGYTCAYSYDRDDRLVGTVDSLGQTLGHVYNKVNRLVYYTDKRGLTENYTYDTHGVVFSHTDTGDLTITYVYDLMDRLTSVTDAQGEESGVPAAYAYDALGKRVTLYNSTGDTQYTYDSLDRITSVTTYRALEKEGRFSHEKDQGNTVTYTCDGDGNLIGETGKDGMDKVELTYLYTVENRLEAVYDKEELLMAAAYDGDGNRVFMLNYNLHTDEDWKGNSGNGNGSNKDNAGSGNNGNSTGNNENFSGNSGNGNGKNKNNRNSGNSSANNGKGGNGKKNGNTGNKGNGGNENSAPSVGAGDTTGSGESVGSTENGNGNGNATNAETNNSQNQSGILFPIASETGDTESYLISLIKTTGKEKNYELIEYINDVNREYAEVLVEQNINGALDTAYVYGAAIGVGSDRLSLDRFDGSTGYYLYDPRGSVTGITNEEGQVYQSYRYSVFGEITFGASQYENEYTYNGESYNPNIRSQYLRARYYCVVTADFLTEDSYQGNIMEPLTLNRYNYCVSSPLNYICPSGNKSTSFLEIRSKNLYFPWHILYRQHLYLSLQKHQ